MPPLARSPNTATVRSMRRALLVILTFATLGMCVDLVLMGHYEDAKQWIPLVIAGAILLVLAWVAGRPGVVALRTMQLAMLVFAATGVLGIVLHFQANAEFQRDIDPTIGSVALFWKVMQATAPPAIAPALMVQLGALGLVYTYRHPALGDDEPGDRTES